ncbi:MAG: S49 family peptidase [Gammaproteobacteria bacterium]|nr:S49 family peptidase [Gammaproteobacteria bacterium]
MTDESREPQVPKDADDSSDVDQEAWQRDLINRLAFASLVEQRRARRWNTLFKFGLLLYLVVVTIIYLPINLFPSPKTDKHTALIDVQGIISEETDASADRVVSGLRAAFEDENTAGIIVRINSPGGSPVQAGYINDEIRRLRQKHPNIPLYAVITDICASGGYYVAAAADKIYANKSSVVGSIGVLMNGFGFVDTMEKLGVERRLLTAGEHKGLLDPFSPARPEEVAHVQKLLDQIHAQFIDVVKRGRGDKLKNEPELFSGLIWTGEEGIALGLVDAIGSSSYVAREVIGAEDIVDFTPSRNVLELLAERFGTAVGGAVAGRVDLGGLELR